MPRLTVTLDIEPDGVTFQAYNSETGSEWVPPYLALTLWTPQGNEMSFQSHARISDARKALKRL